LFSEDREGSETFFKKKMGKGGLKRWSMYCECKSFLFGFMFEFHLFVCFPWVFWETAFLRIKVAFSSIFEILNRDLFFF
jgi:hypothetical protein